MTVRFGPIAAQPQDLARLYDLAAAGAISQPQLDSILTAQAPLLFGIPSLGQTPAGIPLSKSPFAVLANMHPLAAQQFGVQAIQGTAVDRAKLEAAIKDLYAQLHAEGIPLEARPGSVLSEALATGDFSQLANQDLLAVLVAMTLIRQNRNQLNGAIGRPSSPLAPRGSWSNGRNSAGGGYVHSGPNRNADLPSGPAPAGGVIPGGTSTGNRLAACAQNVANSMGSTGYCYRGVKAAVRDATGVQLSGGSAYQAANQLATSGKFQEVSASPDQLRNLPPGAVVVWGQTSRSPHGHISVSLGNGREASDHIQSQMTSLRGAQNYRVFVPVA